jgi:Mrp family chromosome partitioning ATPase
MLGHEELLELEVNKAAQKELAGLVCRLMVKLANIDKEGSQAMENERKLRKQVESLRKELGDEKFKAGDYQRVVDELSDAKDKVVELERKAAVAKSSIVALENEVSLKSSVIAENESRIKGLTDSVGMEIGKVKVESESQVRELNSKLRVANRSIEKNKETISKLQDRNGIVRKKLVKTEELLDSVKEENEALKRKIEDLSGHEVKIEESKYKGSSQLITVTGSSGCGISTVAWSIARVFCARKKVLVIDANVHYADYKKWTSRFDAEYGKTFMNEYIRSGKKDKNLIVSLRKIDCITGIDGALSLKDIYKIDLVDIANWASEVYGYDLIVIDAGPLGCTVETDRIIFDIARYSDKRVLVTRSDLNRLEDVSLEVGRSKMDFETVLNFSYKSNVSPREVELGFGGGILIHDSDVIAEKSGFIMDDDTLKTKFINWVRGKVLEDDE